jgi:hypothetical protein
MGTKMFGMTIVWLRLLMLVRMKMLLLLLEQLLMAEHQGDMLVCKVI